MWWGCALYQSVCCNSETILDEEKMNVSVSAIETKCVKSQLAALFFIKWAENTM